MRQFKTRKRLKHYQKGGGMFSWGAKLISKKKGPAKAPSTTSLTSLMGGPGATGKMTKHQGKILGTKSQMTKLQGQKFGLQHKLGKQNKGIDKLQARIDKVGTGKNANKKLEKLNKQLAKKQKAQAKTLTNIGKTGIAEKKLEQKLTKRESQLAKLRGKQIAKSEEFSQGIKKKGMFHSKEDKIFLNKQKELRKKLQSGEIDSMQARKQLRTATQNRQASQLSKQMSKNVSKKGRFSRSKADKAYLKEQQKIRSDLAEGRISATDATQKMSLQKKNLDVHDKLKAQQPKLRMGDTIRAKMGSKSAQARIKAKAEVSTQKKEIIDRGITANKPERAYLTKQPNQGTSTPTGQVTGKTPGQGTNPQQSVGNVSNQSATTPIKKKSSVFSSKKNKNKKASPGAQETPNQGATLQTSKAQDTTSPPAAQGAAPSVAQGAPAPSASTGRSWSLRGKKSPKGATPTSAGTSGDLPIKKKSSGSLFGRRSSIKKKDKSTPGATQPSSDKSVSASDSTGTTPGKDVSAQGTTVDPAGGVSAPAKRKSIKQKFANFSFRKKKGTANKNVSATSGTPQTFTDQGKATSSPQKIEKVEGSAVSQVSSTTEPLIKRHSSMEKPEIVAGNVSVENRVKHFDSMA